MSMARRKRQAPRQPASSDPDLILGTDDASLLDVVDNVLNKGVVLTGDVTIGLAHVDLIYARLSVLLCAADRVLPSRNDDVHGRHQAPHARRPGSRQRLR
jgi:hypothetical protein